MAARTFICLFGAIVLHLAAPQPAWTEEAPTIEDERARCQNAAAERRALIDGGVLELLDKGAEWARTTAKPDQIDQMRKFIAAQERLMFECPTGFTDSVRAGPPPPPPVRRPTPPPRKAAEPPADADVPLPVRKKAVL